MRHTSCALLLVMTLAAPAFTQTQDPRWTASTEALHANVSVMRLPTARALSQTTDFFVATGGTQGSVNGVSGLAMQMGYDTSIHAGFIQAANFGVGWSPLLLNPYWGTVEIGTAAIPTRGDIRLDVEGRGINGAPTTVLVVGTNDVGYSGSGAAIELAAMNNRGGPDPVGKIAVSLFNGAVNQQTGDMVFYASRNGTLEEKLRILSSGEVDLGTATNLTTEKLLVNGMIESRRVGIKFPDTTVQTTAFVPSTGVLSLSNAAVNSGQQAAFSTSGTGAYVDVAGSATPANNFIAFRTGRTASSNTLTEAMKITGGGSVEINTPVSDPAFKLNVNGDAKITGTLTATAVVNAVYGQDVAEWVRGDRELAAGTVVIVNPEKTNEVMPSSTAYDTTVAGVVSAQPGVILGRPGELKATVATSGRVRVRVDARKGAVHVGDLLVTSDEPGTAMKSQPIDVGGRKFHQPGTILGKALEPLPEGVGEILVLLCLG